MLTRAILFKTIKLKGGSNMHKRVVAIILILALVCLNVPTNVISLALVNNENKDDYVIVSQNNVIDKIDSGLIDNINQEIIVPTDNTLSISLSENQVERIKKANEEVIIEKDILLTADTLGTEDVDEILDNVLGGSTTSEEEYPSNIKMVNGDLPETVFEALETVKIGILDSGVSYNDELNIAQHVSLIPNMPHDNAGASYDISGHGTSIAGVIGSKIDDKGIIGIYPNVEIYAIQVMNNDNTVPLSRVVEGINWAIENDIDVLNMSFGTSVNSEILHNAIKEAYNNNMLMVAAAGNTSNTTQYPAKYPEVLSVGAVNGDCEVSSFSASDEFVDIYAPGEGVVTTGIFNGYMAVDGTSVAAPHVTAAAAVLFAKDKTRSNDYIMQLIKSTANTTNNVHVLDIENSLDCYDNFEYVPSINYEIEDEYNNYSTDIISEYDSDSIAVGSWSKTDHKTLINNNSSANSISTNNIKLMAAASSMADEIYGTSYTNSSSDTTFMYKFYPLHAYGYTSSASSNTLVSYNSNFLADTKYLYRLARYYLNSDSVTSANTQSNIDEVTKAGANYSILQKVVFSSTAIYTNPQVNYGDSRGTVENVAVKGIVKMNIVEGISEDTVEERAFKILGLAIHLAGDAYAHRVRVPVSSTESGGCFYTKPSDGGFNKSHTVTYNQTNVNKWLKEKHLNDAQCRCFECFKKAVASAHVEFRDIKAYNDKDIKNYEDLSNFYTKRYSIATKHATNRLISRFVANQDFTLFVFLPSDTDYKLKLNYLRGYIDDTGMNWDGLEQSTRDRVLALSTGSLI